MSDALPFASLSSLLPCSGGMAYLQRDSERETHHLSRSIAKCLRWERHVCFITITSFSPARLKKKTHPAVIRRLKHTPWLDMEVFQEALFAVNLSRRLWTFVSLFIFIFLNQIRSMLTPFGLAWTLSRKVSNCAGVKSTSCSLHIKDLLLKRLIYDWLADV